MVLRRISSAEYMAGGIALVLGLNMEDGEKCVARFVGTGMHGGVIYTRGDIFKLSEGVQNRQGWQT